MNRNEDQETAERLQDTRSGTGLLFVGNFLSAEGRVPQACEDLSNRFEQEGWTVLRTSSKRRQFTRLVDMVWTAVRHPHEFDIAQIDVFSGQAFVFAEVMSTVLRMQGKPYVLTLHGGQLPELAARNPGRVRRLLGAASAVTCPSAYLAERMSRLRDDIRVIPNPIDMAAFAYQKREQVRPNLVWVRAFHDVYEPWVAVEVLGHLSRSYPEANLVMYGPDKVDGSLSRTEQTIDRMGVQDHVSIGGPLPHAEVPRALRSADVFLNTTAVDNVPRSVVEAMACGLCIVSTDVGGVSKLVRNGISGLLVEPGDPLALAKAVETLLKDPVLASQLSSAGLESAEEHDGPKVISMWKNLFAEIRGRSH